VPVSKIDPKVIFASEAPTQDTPAVFTNKTVGWGESRKNGGRPTIKQSNALQQETDLKILWLNENSVTPYDASIDYPVNAVTIKDGAFKIFNGSVWNLFLNKSSVGLNNVDNTSDLNKPVSTATQDSFDEIYENGACLPYDPTITYVLGSLVLRDGIIQKVVAGGTEPLIGNTDAVKVIDGNQTQKEINLYGGKKYDMPVGGYPLNSIVLLNTGGLVRSTISNNTNNPNTLLTGWVKTNAASQLFTEGGQTLQSVADEARPVTKGGTGATNAEDARANLDVYSQAEVDFAIDEAVSETTPLATESTAGKAKIATTAIAQAGLNDTDFITALKLKQTLGASKSVLAGSVNFNGTGTVSIRSQLNVSSITDLGVGKYRINMTTAMPNANYPVFTSVANRSSETTGIGIEVKAQTVDSITVYTFVTGTGAAIDVDFISVGWTL
jgi:hypothetical protein